MCVCVCVIYGRVLTKRERASERMRVVLLLLLLLREGDGFFNALCARDCAKGAENRPIRAREEYVYTYVDACKCI